MCHYSEMENIVKDKIIHTKMSPEELSQYLIFKHRGTSVTPAKGKGKKYNRAKDRKKCSEGE